MLGPMFFGTIQRGCAPCMMFFVACKGAAPLAGDIASSAAAGAIGPPQVGPARKKRKKKVEPKRKRRKNHTIRVGVDLLYIPPKGMYMSIYPLKIV